MSGGRVLPARAQQRGAERSSFMFGPPPQLSLELERTGSAAREVRVQLQRLAAGSASRGAIDDVLLLASELVSNAVRHTSGAIGVSAWCSPEGRWWVEVEDESVVPPVVQTVPPEQLGGRGMQIVDALASCWGVARTKVGKRCWFELQT